MKDTKKTGHLEAQGLKIIMIVILLVTLISGVNAFDFDNRISYKDSNKIVAVKNLYGFGSTVGEFKITSHDDLTRPIQVMPGKDRIVMTYDFYNFDSIYRNGIGNIEFTDAKSGEKIKKIYKIEEIVYKEYDSPIVNTICNNPKDRDDCSTEIIGYTTNKIISQRKPFNIKDIPPRNITLALVTDVYHGDYIDGIWTIAGEKVERHATWNATFETDLMLVYNFNQTGATQRELFYGNYNLTQAFTPTLNVSTSVLPNGYNVPNAGSGYFYYGGASMIIPKTNGTIIMWLQSEDPQSSTRNWWSTDDVNEYRLGTSGGNLQLTIGGNNVILDATATYFEPGRMFMATVTYDTVADIYKFYVNNTLRITSTSATAELDEPGFYVGITSANSRQFEGNITDIKVYNRTLTLGEITSHYDNGVGVEYQDIIASTGVSVSLDSPGNDFQSLPVMMNFNSSAVAVGYNLTNATLYIWRNNGTFYGRTENVTSGASNSSTFYFNVSNAGTYDWNVIYTATNGTTNITQFSTTNNTFTIISFSVNSIRYNTTAYETDNETFVLNVTLQPNIIFSSANLVYNGTVHSATSEEIDGYTIYTSSIDIPLTSGTAATQNKSFYFTLDLYDGTYQYQQSTAINNQTVNRIYLSPCGSGNMVQSLNFTLWREDNRTFIAPNKMEIAGTLSSWLGGGSTKRNNSFYNDSITEEVLCINPPARTFNFDGYIEYDGAGAVNATFYERDYYFQNAVASNSTQHIKLFALERTSSTSFIQKVVTTSQNPVVGALISSLRYYPEDNSYEVVQISRTDENGETIGFFETEIPDYKTIITLNGTVLLVVSDRKIIPQTVPYTLLYTIGETLVNPWETFNGLTNLVSTLSYNSTTKIVSYTYVDISGTLSLANLSVYKINPSNESALVCSRTSVLAAGILSCNVSNQTGNFQATAYIYRTSNNLDKVVTFTIDSLTSLMKTPFLLMFWIILVSVTLLGIYNPTIGIILNIVVLILGGMLGIVGVTSIFIWAFVAIAIYFIVEVNS